MALQGNEHFPIIEYWTEEELYSHGYVRKFASIFDHFLSVEKANNYTLFSLTEAIYYGDQDEYLIQESCFVSFYNNLFKDGVFRRTGIGHRHSQIAWHAKWDRRLKKDVLRSLRDRRHFDIYVSCFSLRVVGNWDRTDVLLFERPEELPSVAALASRCGLFLI